MTGIRNRPMSNSFFARMDAGMIDFQAALLSTAQGEMRNDRWNLLLHRRSQTSGDIDQDNTFRHHGSQSNEMFKNPY